VLAKPEPDRSTFELRWRVFGIHFRVMPSFWLISAVIAYVLFNPLLGRDPTRLALGIATDVGSYFLALVAMELVQGLVYRSYGIGSTAVIQDFGSTIMPDEEPPTRLQRITAALSAPASAWLMFALVYYSNQSYGWRDVSFYTLLAYELLWIATLFWGIIGLLPIYPYPGGLVLLELLTAISPRGGLAATLVVSIGVALAYVAYTVLYLLGHVPLLRLRENVRLPPSIVASVFFGISVLHNWQLLRHALARRSDDREAEYESHSPWEK